MCLILHVKQLLSLIMAISCLWFLASLIYINNCPTRCNTKRSIYYSASSLDMFRVSDTPIIRCTQNCNYSLRYYSYFLCSYLPPTWPSLATLEGGSCTVLDAIVTILCTPDDGCVWHPKHVEITCRIINRLLCESYDYWIVHLLDSWVKRDQLDVTCFIISLFNVHHVWDVNTSILRSLRLMCWVISWLILLWFDVCWCYVMVCLGYGIRMQAEALLGSMCVGVTLWYGCGCVVSLYTLKH